MFGWAKNGGYLDNSGLIEALSERLKASHSASTASPAPASSPGEQPRGESPDTPLTDGEKEAWRTYTESVCGDTWLSGIRRFETVPSD